jgi:hypothetical protein
MPLHSLTAQADNAVGFLFFMALAFLLKDKYQAVRFKAAGALTGLAVACWTILFFAR